MLRGYGVDGELRASFGAPAYRSGRRWRFRVRHEDIIDGDDSTVVRYDVRIRRRRQQAGGADFDIVEARRYKSRLDVAHWFYYAVQANVPIDHMRIPVRIHHAEFFTDCSDSYFDLEAGRTRGRAGDPGHLRVGHAVVCDRADGARRSHLHGVSPVHVRGASAIDQRLADRAERLARGTAGAGRLRDPIAYRRPALSAGSPWVTRGDTRGTASGAARSPPASSSIGRGMSARTASNVSVSWATAISSSLAALPHNAPGSHA